jgi:hypothetical protein
VRRAARGYGRDDRSPTQEAHTMQGGNENPPEEKDREPVGVHPDRQGDEPTDEELGGPGAKEEADAEADVQQSGP